MYGKVIGSIKRKIIPMVKEWKISAKTQNIN
jgi:hypothetical protein